FCCSKAMEQLLAAVEQSHHQHQMLSRAQTAAVAQEGTFSSRFRLDGQPILPPLMTGSKRRDAQLAQQMAVQLEEQLRLARCSAGSEQARCGSTMSNKRNLPQLQQTETFIYDSTKSRPKTLGLVEQQKPLLPTIQVNPPTPHAVENELRITPPRSKPNRITNRILQFELTGLGNLLPSASPVPGPASPKPIPRPSPPRKCILRSSTSPALAPLQAPAPLEQPQTQLEPPGVQRSRSFTLDEPSQVLVEHMARKAQAEANYQQETVESKAKRVFKSPGSSSISTSTSTCSRSRTRRTETAEREREIEQIIERALGENGPTEATRKAGLRKYLRGHRERLNQLVQYQEEERRRMLAEFDRQQRFLIDALCAEIEDEPGSVSGSGLGFGSGQTLVSEYTSTGDLNAHAGRDSATPSCSSPSNTITISSCLETTPRSYEELDEFLHMEDSCRRAPTSSARKRLFSPKLSLGYESEPQLLGEISAPSTPRSLPLRNSSMSNSRRRSGPASGQTAPARRSRTVASPRKANISGAGGGVVKSPARVVGGSAAPIGRKKSAPASSSVVKKNGNINFPFDTRQKQEQEQDRDELQELEQEWAATKINAAVRGFLVRRLFGTEQVQRIVQTIRDTLIFVLNLHLETCGNGLDVEETANLRLKARLLQQLCSASRTLHLIFFQTSTKERMDIISRDRKRIKTKLMALHLKHR
ncbi:hypothetical protein KR009_002718, partial [Drosophila setifemur]